MGFPMHLSFLEVGFSNLSSLRDLLLELVKVHFEVDVVRFWLHLRLSHRVGVLLLQVSDLLHEVSSVLDVIDLGNQLLLEPFGGIEALILLADHHLQVVVGFLDLRDVDSLELLKLKSAIALTSAIWVNHWNTTSF